MGASCSNSVINFADLAALSNNLVVGFNYRQISEMIQGSAPTCREPMESSRMKRYVTSIFIARRDCLACSTLRARSNPVN